MVDKERRVPDTGPGAPDPGPYARRRAPDPGSDPRPSSAAGPGTPTAGPEPRRWVPWAVGFGMLLAGFLIGLGAQLLLPPGATAGRPPRVNPALLPRTGTDRAQASDPTTVQTPPGQPVQLTWVLTNTGTTTWKPIDFRFDPAEGEGPVIPLRPPLIKQFSLKQQKYLPVPVAMAPGVEVPVEVTLTAPAEPGIYPYAWQLIGPDGPVPGGRLAATLIVAPAEPAH